ncbi:uncharacterized protein OCT59_021233 [Rhizophagus irregularis]|uniref:uncharacterized protein n=1 Tax=Rhizophagus irregularis TaxID=588596 RepID=UPI00333420A9|nr:hypothetical protein OCT59_021233 [Rhizophagus irregularis]
MEEFVLTDDIIEQIKDFDHEGLIEEQSLLIDKLILNEELKKRYKKNGLCKECKQPNTYYQGDYSIWCMSCNAKNFQQNFKNWTSGNHEVDKFIQKTQLKAKNLSEVLEWIEYDRFENIEYLTKGGFGTIYKAIWKDGRIKSWDFENNKWTRSKYYCREYEDFPVVLKCLHNSQDISSDFLRIIETHMFVSNYGDRITKCYGITKDPESRNFMIVMGYAKDVLNIIKQCWDADPLKRPKANELEDLFDKLYDELDYDFDEEYINEIYKQVEEAEKLMKTVYTSRLLDFKNLPEPINAIDNKDDDNSFGEYSESIEAIDFTKLDPRSS